MWVRSFSHSKIYNLFHFFFFLKIETKKILNPTTIEQIHFYFNKIHCPRKIRNKSRHIFLFKNKNIINIDYFRNTRNMKKDVENEIAIINYFLFSHLYLTNVDSLAH